MKNFIKENWYKLMIGSSLLMASFGFMVHSVSPVHAESQANSFHNSNSGYNEGEWVYFIANTYMHKIKKGSFKGVFDDCDYLSKPNSFNYSKNSVAFYKKIK